MKPGFMDAVIQLKHSGDVVVQKTIYYNDAWGKLPMVLDGLQQVQIKTIAIPGKLFPDDGYKYN